MQLKSNVFHSWESRARENKKTNVGKNKLVCDKTLNNNGHKIFIDTSIHQYSYKIQCRIYAWSCRHHEHNEMHDSSRIAIGIFFPSS